MDENPTQNFRIEDLRPRLKATAQPAATLAASIPTQQPHGQPSALRSGKGSHAPGHSSDLVMSSSPIQRLQQASPPEAVRMISPPVQLHTAFCSPIPAKPDTYRTGKAHTINQADIQPGHPHRFHILPDHIAFIFPHTSCSCKQVGWRPRLPCRTPNARIMPPSPSMPIAPLEESAPCSLTTGTPGKSGIPGTARSSLLSPQPPGAIRHQ